MEVVVTLRSGEEEESESEDGVAKQEEKAADVSPDFDDHRH